MQVINHIRSYVLTSCQTCTYIQRQKTAFYSLLPKKEALAKQKNVEKHSLVHLNLDDNSNSASRTCDKTSMQYTVWLGLNHKSSYTCESWHPYYCVFALPFTKKWLLKMPAVYCWRGKKSFLIFIRSLYFVFIKQTFYE